MIFKASSPSELSDVAEYIVSLINSERKIFAFYGEMGVGKTTLITETIEKVMGSNDGVTSPTFSIVNEYLDSLGNPLYHFDFYRLKSEEEAFDIGYEDYFYSGQPCFIEWPERINSLIPPEAVRILLTNEEGIRTIEFKVPS